MPLFKLSESFLVSLLFISLITSCAEKENEEFSTPNVLFIAVDDLRPELGCYGADHIISPHIDRLASQATLFENAYCNIPVCGASRASLLTGLRPTLTRFKSYLTRADEDAPTAITLPALFRRNGYKTISNGKIFHHSDDSADAWDEIWRPKGISWRDYQDPQNIQLDTTEGMRGPPFEDGDVEDGSYNDGKTTEKSIADLKKLKQEGKPFFLAVGYLKPHLPFNAPRKYWELYDSTSIELPENRFRPSDVPSQALHNFGELRHYSGVPAEGPVTEAMAKKLIHGYYACVSYTDALIGKLLTTLDELDLDDETIVILWGDHGWNLLEHGLWCKHCNYRTSLQVPLILKTPDQRQGLRRSEMVEFVDIYPTLQELCSLPDPGHLQGNSLLPLLNEGTRQTWKSSVESIWHNGFTYTTHEYAYTEWRSENDSVLARMLFSHQEDPDENKNLLHDNEAIPQAVHDILEQWQP